MRWKQLLYRIASSIGIIFAMRQDVQLRKFLWVSAGFPRLEGQLVAIYRDGREKPLYYIMSKDNLPIHPVGEVCQ